MEVFAVVRIVQLLFAVLVLGLSTYVASWYNTSTTTASPSQINFLLAASIFSAGAVAYLELTPRFLKWASHPFVLFTLEIIVTIFYLSGFISLSIFLSELRFCRGHVCAAARADAVFAAFSFAVWNFTAIVFGMGLFRGGFRAAQGNIAKSRAMREKGTV